MENGNENYPIKPENHPLNEPSTNKPLNRRGFLSFWKRMFTPPPRHENSVKPSENNTAWKGPVLDRRQFLEFLLATGTTLAVEHGLGIKTAGAGELDIAEKNNDNLHYQNINQEPNLSQDSHQQKVVSENEPSLTDTAVEGALFSLANLVSGPILTKLKIPIGNSGLDKETQKKLLEMSYSKLLTVGGGVVPLIEEAIFRALPQLAIRDKSKDALWKVGIPLSAVFALGHNIKKDKETGNRYFATDTIPLQQFVGGLFFWKMMRERGFSHAVLAHSEVNSTALGVAKFLYETFPNSYKKEKSEETQNK